MDEFVEKTDVLKKNMDEIAHSINTITTVVDDGAAGVNNAAISTQDLVEDMVNISNKMIENKGIAQNLKGIRISEYGNVVVQTDKFFDRLYHVPLKKA